MFVFSMKELPEIAEFSPLKIPSVPLEHERYLMIEAASIITKDRDSPCGVFLLVLPELPYLLYMKR